MKKRCLNPKHNRFHRYGGRGIKVCERWMSFSNFLADMGRAPRGCSIDRINNDGDYEPGNCRWATNTEQVMNRSHGSFGVVTINGVSKLISVWLKETGVSYNAYWIRKTRRGWSDIDAIFTPARPQHRINHP